MGVADAPWSVLGAGVTWCFITLTVVTEEERWLT